jgi:CcmD family protein
MSYLYAAYLIVWGVIMAYIFTMLRGFKRVSQELRELEK